MDVPERFLIEMSPEDLGQRLRLYAALLMFRAGELSAGAACELGDVDRYTFLNECKRLGIETLDATADELETDVGLLAGTSGAGSR